MIQTKGTLENCCKNCGEATNGKYCSNCGQKTHFDSDPSLYDFTNELIHEFLHLDGKIFRTLRVLFTKPGFLTQELLNGRRNSYIGPIRLYLAISIVMFLLNNAFSKDMQIKEPEQTQIQELPKIEKVEDAEKPLGFINKLVAAFTPKVQLQKINDFNRTNPNALVEFGRTANPKVFFVLVPVLALLLQMSYFGSKRKFVPYLYFSLHLHAGIFAVMTLILPMQVIDDYFKTDVVTYFSVLAYLWNFIYFTLGIRRVWGGSLTTSIVRATAVSLAYVVCFYITIFLFVIVFVNYHS